MPLKDNWIDRQNGVDNVDAEDINKVARAVIEVEERLGDYIQTPATATIGQTIVVKTIDTSGKPTEWQAADMPSTVTDDHINSLIDTKLGVIENGSY